MFKRILLFVLLAAAIYTISQAIDALARLEVVEHERDKWQRPTEIVQALNLREGARAVDLGSGAGYFALKLSSAVGTSGRVLALDLRRISLTFLWIRALLHNRRNLTVKHGDASDPRLWGPVDAVLIVNTYHELTHAKSILKQVRRSLIPGGRLVIADRTEGAGQHEFPVGQAEAEVRESGLEIIRREDHFLDQPDEGPWWLIVAGSPPRPAP